MSSSSIIFHFHIPHWNASLELLQFIKSWVGSSMLVCFPQRLQRVHCLAGVNRLKYLVLVRLVHCFSGGNWNLNVKHPGWQPYCLWMELAACCKWCWCWGCWGHCCTANRGESCSQLNVTLPVVGPKTPLQTKRNNICWSCGWLNVAGAWQPKVSGLRHPARSVNSAFTQPTVKVNLRDVQPLHDRATCMHAGLQVKGSDESSCKQAEPQTKQHVDHKCLLQWETESLGPWSALKLSHDYKVACVWTKLSNNLTFDL